MVLWSGFGGLIERFRFSLYKLIVLIKGFHGGTPPPCGPVDLWSGFGGLIKRFRLSLQAYRSLYHNVYKGVLCALKKVCRRFFNSIASV